MVEICQANRHGHVPEVKEEVLTHHPTRLSNSVLDWRQRLSGT
jgi:hypothetical protein